MRFEPNNSLATTSDTAWVALIPEVPVGRRRLVRMLALDNLDTGAVSAVFALERSGSYYGQATLSAVAAGIAASVEVVLVLLAGDTLAVKLTAAAAANDPEASAHWADEILEE